MSEATVLKAFEEWTRVQGANWNLGRMNVNGKFHRYMDPDTDSAWLGYQAGYKMAAHKQKEAMDGMWSALDAVLNNADKISNYDVYQIDAGVMKQVDKALGSARALG